MEALRLIVQLTHTKFNTIIDYLDISIVLVFLSKTIFWRLDSLSVLRYKAYSVGPNDRASPYLLTPEKIQGRIYKDRTMDNV
jgi:hypothetical protein